MLKYECILKNSDRRKQTLRNNNYLEREWVLESESLDHTDNWHGALKIGDVVTRIGSEFHEITDRKKEFTNNLVQYIDFFRIFGV